MEEKRFTLRMDGELFKEVSELAKDHRRSVAKEIEVAIAQYVVKTRESEYATQANTKSSFDKFK